MRDRAVFARVENLPFSKRSASERPITRISKLLSSLFLDRATFACAPASGRLTSIATAKADAENNSHRCLFKSRREGFIIVPPKIDFYGKDSQSVAKPFSDPHRHPLS